MDTIVNAVKCGKGHGYHESVADVRRCYNGEDVPLIDVGRTPGGQDAASPKQVSYANDLLSRHNVQTVKPVSAYGRREISALINLLRSAGRISQHDMKVFALVKTQDGASLAPNQPRDYVDPRATRERFDSQSLEDGFYVFEGDVYKVVVAVHGTGRKYARRLDTNGKWVRTPGLSKLRPEHKMTLQEALSTAKRHGLNIESRLYGHCFVCGRTLTDEESISNGIGPVCAGKFS